MVEFTDEFTWLCPKCLEQNIGDDLICTACGHEVPRSRTVDDADRKELLEWIGPWSDDEAAEVVLNRAHVKNSRRPYLRPHIATALREARRAGMLEAAEIARERGKAIERGPWGTNANIAERVGNKIAQAIERAAKD